jgi:2-(1,2-epoxy-1,2-dihydrophenyl)acetyl-CoA isomerase
VTDAGQSGARQGTRAFTSVQDGVLRCVLSTAERGASLNFDAARELTAALRNLEPDVGAVLLRGEGPNFCTGGDVKAFAEAKDLPETVEVLAGELHDLVRAFARVPVPVVAAVHGWAAGAGMSLVLAADIAVAGTSTRLRPAYPAIGLAADGGLNWTLPRAVGAARARHILLTDRILTAEEAVELGIVSMVVADDAVQAEALAIAEGLAEGPAGALGRIKKLLRESAGRDLDAQLDAEAVAMVESAASDEGREGVAAFFERRAPRFRA